MEPILEVRWIDTDAKILDGRGWLQSNDVCCKVQCPLVFSPTRWAVRPLTLKELLSVHDLSEKLSALLEGVSPLPFVGSAPGRLLGAVLGSINHAGQPKLDMAPGICAGPIGLGLTEGTEDAPLWPQVPGAEWSGVSESTTKADDAQAHISLWDQRVLERFPWSEAAMWRFKEQFGRSGLDSIRNFLLSAWRRRVCISLLQFLEGTQGSVDFERNREVGRDALEKVSQATWWDWTGGSTPFFWRWPPYARLNVRDGHQPWFISEPPRYVKPQRAERDEDLRSKMAVKLQGVVAKGYIALGEVSSLTTFFAVPKGLDDIQMVYDAMASGLNASLGAQLLVAQCRRSS